MDSQILTTDRKLTTSLINNTYKNRLSLFEANSRLWMVGFLVTTDLFGLFASIVLALQIRQIPGIFIDPSYLEVFGLLAITLVILFGRNGLYPGIGLNYVEELRRIAISTSFAFIVMVGITFILKTTSYYSRIALVISWLLALAIIPLSRYFMRKWMIRLKLWGEPVMIIGNLQKALKIKEKFETNPHLGLRPMAMVQDDHGADYTHGIHTEPISAIRTHAYGLSLQTALIVIDDLNDIDRLVERYRTIFQRVIMIKDKNGRYGLNSLEAMDFSSILGLQVKNNLLNQSSQTIKRLIDICASLIGLILLSPLLGLIALCIWLDEPGRVLYRQMRIGRSGKVFKLLKFRTMHLGAAQVLEDALAQDPVLKLEWDKYQKLKNDPRITRVGKYLRKFSLDELPQLWNIARGEMSLVGPRPMLSEQQEMYGEAFKNYIRVTPGLTGLWQVSGRNETTFARRAELDDEYIQCWSMWLDIYILFKTIEVVFGKGAF